MLYQIILFFKAARMLSLFQGPPNISWHRAPKKLDTALAQVTLKIISCLCLLDSKKDFAHLRCSGSEESEY